MAAVLGRALCAPCKLCAKGCDKACTACGHGLDSCCAAIGKGCGALCKACSSCAKECDKCCAKIGCAGLCGPLDKVIGGPLAVCALFTVAANGLPLLAFIVVLLLSPDGTKSDYNTQFEEARAQCPYDVSLWLVGQIIVMYLDTVLAWRLMLKFRAPYDRTDKNDRDFYARLSHLLCEDVGIALWILLLIFSFVWQGLGTSWVSAARDSHCASSALDGALEAALIVQFIFLIGGLMMIFLLLMHSWCETRFCPAYVDTPCGWVTEMCCPCFICLPNPEDEVDATAHEPRRAVPVAAAPAATVAVPVEALPTAPVHQHHSVAYSAGAGGAGGAYPPPSAPPAEVEAKEHHATDADKAAAAAAAAARVGARVASGAFGALRAGFRKARGSKHN